MNLDELNQAKHTVYTDADKAAMFDGIVMGCNFADLPGGVPQSFVSGYALGRKWRQEAEDFMESSANSGRAGAEAKRLKYGTAQPIRKTPLENSLAPLGESPYQATSHKPQALSVQPQATTSFASLTSAESSQQSENTAGEQSAAPTQTLASSQISNTQPQIEVLATRPASKQRPAPADSVASSIYALYPRKVAKAAALKAIKKALVENPDIDIPEAVKEYAKATASWKEDDKRFIPYPASWFNGGCFMDDRAEWWKKSTTAPAVSRGRKI